MQSVGNNNRVYSIDYETPIMIPMGSNPNNPFAKDEEEDKKEFGFGDMMEFVIVAVCLGFLLSIPYFLSQETKRANEMLSTFENNGTLWCKPGYDINSEIRITKSDGWEYLADEEMFINERIGVRVGYSSESCR